MIETLLIVDDSSHTRQMCRLAAEGRGIRVLESRDAFGGLNRARAERPDLLVVSSSLPGADGLALVEHLRSCGVTAPAALVSTPLEEFDMAMLEVLGVGAVIQRPVCASVIRALIETEDARRAA